MSFIIGLTGPTGAGKSEASLIFKECGFFTVDCDKVAKEVTQKNSCVIKKLCEVFGQDILCNDNTLDRKKLARIAFSSKENTELLNRTVLPAICEKITEIIRDKDKVLLDAPTLFESGLDKTCDKTVCIFANEDIRLKRITARDNIEKHDALLRIRAGKAETFYKSRTDFFILNNGDFELFKSQLTNIINNIDGGI